jgi:dUTP pyrophosphatase
MIYKKDINIQSVNNYKMSADLLLKFIRNNSGKQYGILKIAFKSSDNNTDFKNQYNKHIANHNSISTFDGYPNAGFDILMPSETIIKKNQFSSSQLVPLDIKCEMVDENNDPIGFYMYPRSSISKTPLALANHVGVIDSGYRGVLMAAFRNLDSNSDFKIEKNNRLLQITHPGLCPIFVKVVDESELSNTSRGAGGFGSTGI